MAKKALKNTPAKADKEVNKGGRPKEGLETLPDGWQGYILNEYRAGASDVEIRAMIHGWRGRFSEDLWRRWIEEEPEFSRTITQGRLLAEAWWYKMGRLGVLDESIRPAMWFMNMKNRYGWAEKREMSIGGSGSDNGNTFTLNFNKPQIG